MNYHADRFEEYSQLLYKKDRLIAVLPANRVGDILYSHQGLTYGGLIIAPQTKLKDLLPAYTLLLETLKADGIATLHTKQIPAFYAKQPSEEMDYLMFVTDAKITRVDTASVIDLQETIPIQSNRMEGVTKARKLGLVVKEEDEFEGFWNTVLLPNLEQRHGAKPTHSFDEITLLKQRFPKEIRQFNVYHKDTIVGGATIFDTETTAHVQYISAIGDRQALGTLDFLFHTLITGTLSRKRYFSFGISNKAAGKKLNVGLNYWKECFGARTYVHRFYEVPTAHVELLKQVAL